MPEQKKVINNKILCAIVATGILSFAGVATETAMNLAFSKIMAEFGVATDDVQWLTTGYLLVLSLIIPLSSYFKQRFTNKRLFAAAVAVFTTGTLLAMTAGSFAQLLVGRLVQGLGTGIGLPLMFNIILEQVPPERTGSMVGMACLVTAVAPAVGPFAGGFIITYWGWRMIFAVLLPVLAVACVMGLTAIKQVSLVSEASFKWLDYLFIVIGFTALVLGTSCSAKLGWLSGATLLLFAAGFLALCIFYYRARRQQAPLLDVAIFHNAKFSLSLLSVIILQFIVLGLSFLLPNYAQLVLGDDPFSAGTILIPGCIAGFIITPIGGRLLDAFGAARPILAGNILALIGACAIGSFLGLGSWALMFAYVVFASGQALMMANTFTNAMAQLTPVEKRSGNAAFNTFQQLAGAFGTSVTASIVAASQAAGGSFAAATEQGTAYALLLLIVLMVCILLCSCKIFNLRISGICHIWGKTVTSLYKSL